MTKFTFTGTPEDIKKQIQDTVASYKITEISFEKWFEKWESGFLDFTENRTNNFLLTGEQQWGRIKNPETRPKYKEWLDPQQKEDYSFRLIEYWQDRANEADSVLFSGTDLQIIQHIIQYEYTRNSSQQSVSSDVIRYSGIPEITLYFKGTDKNKIVEGEKSFRFAGYTDNPRVAQKREGLELITEADINRVGAKIRTIFKTKPPYKWSKGKEQVIYHDWQQGYNLNVYANSHAEGERLVTAILSIFNHQIDETYLKHGKAKNPAKAYPPSTEIELFGRKYDTPERLPTADVDFKYGKIYLPTTRETKVIA